MLKYEKIEGPPPATTARQEIIRMLDDLNNEPVGTTYRIEMPKKTNSFRATLCDVVRQQYRTLAVKTKIHEKSLFITKMEKNNARVD